MMDCSFRVDRGADQSILFNIFTNEARTTRKDITGHSVTAFIGVGSPTLTKALRIVDAVNGVAALDLTRVESRSIALGNRMEVEIQLIDLTPPPQDRREFIIGRGRVTGLGGMNADT